MQLKCKMQNVFKNGRVVKKNDTLQIFALEMIHFVCVLDTILNKIIFQKYQTHTINKLFYLNINLVLFV